MNSACFFTFTDFINSRSFLRPNVPDVFLQLHSGCHASDLVSVLYLSDKKVILERYYDVSVSVLENISAPQHRQEHQ